MSVEENRSGSSDSEDESEHLSSEVEESVEVQGFWVLVSKEKQVKEMFKDHPNLSSDFDIERKQIKNAYFDMLLDVVETLSNSINVFSWKDFIKANSMLYHLTSVGFKLDWLLQRLDESYVKEEKKRVSRAKIKELKKLIKKQKLKLSNLESDLKKERAAVAAAEAQVY